MELTYNENCMKQLKWYIIYKENWINCCNCCGVEERSRRYESEDHSLSQWVKRTGESLGQKTSMLCAQERGVMKTPDKSLAGCRESKKRINVCLTSQGSWGNKLHKEGHKQKCKGASERLSGADGAQKAASDGSRLPTSVLVQLRPHPHPRYSTGE